MKRFLAALRKTLGEMKDQKRVERYATIISSEPFTVELVRKIAKDYGYGFEIKDRDGRTLIFRKDGMTIEKLSPFIDLEEQSLSGQ